ncbi:MAG: hypothetical protein CMA72_09695 [Euryarchaeota archaeon]|nr:hypothetical protein [Euryarchaeota archaeon]|tara:strand:- start:2208 stop:2402 length:195 start_codon:yes stop_codon:yes gene_type:complete
MFVFLLLVGCFNPGLIVETSIKEKQILINVEEAPEVEKLQFTTGKVKKIRLTNETAVHFFHEQT